jgi:hypothetical protein
MVHQADLPGRRARGRGRLEHVGAGDPVPAGVLPELTGLPSGRPGADCAGRYNAAGRKPGNRRRHHARRDHARGNRTRRDASGRCPATGPARHRPRRGGRHRSGGHRGSHGGRLSERRRRPGRGGNPACPCAPPPAHAAATHISAAHPAAAAHQAAQTAGHVSRAAQHGQSLPDRVWHDIERYASEPQFAAAFLAAVGAAGVTALVASIAESRKKDKQAKEAARRQAMLDELTRSAGEHEGPAGSASSPGQRAGLSLVWPPSGEAPGHVEVQEPDGQPEADLQPDAGPQPQAAPKLSLVVAATGPEEALTPACHHPAERADRDGSPVARFLS